MNNLYWLSEDQMWRLRLYFPMSRGRARVDDRRVLSGIIFINRNGLRWCDAPTEYGPHKTSYNLWKRWSYMGVFARIMEGFAAKVQDNRTISIKATYLKVHRTVSSLGVKSGAWMFVYHTKGGSNTKLHAVTDMLWRPIRFFMIARRVSDYTGTRALVRNLPAAAGYWKFEAMTQTGSVKHL
jgi:transposase